MHQIPELTTTTKHQQLNHCPSFNANPFLQFIWQIYFLPQADIPSDEKMQHFTQMLTPTHNNSSQLREISNLQKENSHLRAQLSTLKTQKNSCEQKIINLSNTIYQLQRALTASCEGGLHGDGNCTLDQFSAISIDRYEQRQPQRNYNCPLFSKKTSFNLELNDYDARSEDNNQIQELQSLNLNLIGRGRQHPLKQSLQVGYGENMDHNHFVQEMKRMKMKAQRMVHLDSMVNRQKRRNTYGPLTERPSVDTVSTNQNRRFKRIRA